MGKRKTGAIIGLIFCLLQGQLGLASEPERNKPAKASRPVGDLRKTEPASLVIKNEACDCDNDPATRDVILTTVGAESEADGQKSFHPYLSIAVDLAYAADDHGEWLAVWNLGMSAPGALARVHAAIPGLFSSKEATPQQIAKLERIKANVPEYLKTGALDPPRPYLDVTQKHTGSNWRLLATVLRNVLRVTHAGAQFVARTYLLNWKDYHERYFQQAYLSLDWYDDAAVNSDETLSTDQINDIKFRLITNRSAFGHWVDEEAAMNVVYGYETQVRRWQAKTSAYLQIAANEHHLGYAEIMRLNDTGPPTPVAGVLYYDPALAPAPETIAWPSRNPFDLTYNPFTSTKVQHLASQYPGEKIPLAVYVFQTALLVKPIIVADFFDANNPRHRQTLATTKKLGDQAMASTGVGFLIKNINRAVNFVTNKTGFTYLATKSSRLGIEELRMALQSDLYFNSEMSREMLDRLDRLVLNPLIKPGRVEKLTAEINYEALRADEAKAVCREVERIRDKRIRQLAGNARGPLAPADRQRYRQHLAKQPHLRLLRAFAYELPQSGIELEKVRRALSVYIDAPDRTDDKARQTIFDLRLTLMQLQRQNRLDEGRAAVLSLSDAALKSLYPACGLTPAQLDRDLNQAAAKQIAREAKEREKMVEQQGWSFEDNLKKQIEFLKGFLQSGCDVRRWSPSYWEQAMEFFSAVPAVTAGNSEIREKYEKRAKEIQFYLTSIARHLSTQPAVADGLLTERRGASLEAAQHIAQVLFEAEQRKRMSNGVE
jgi:hypothetical protein